MTLLARLFGTAYMAYHLRGQADYPFRPLAAIRADQSRRVRQMVAYAYRYVPYYRDTLDRLGLRPADFQSAKDLPKLPLLEREQVQRDPEYFSSAAQPLTRYIRLRTSGSTGGICTFYHDARSLLEGAAHGGRARAVIAPLVGRSTGYRKTMVFPAFGSSLMVQQFYHERSLLPRRVRLDRQYLSLLDPPETNIRLINGFKPDVIHSYGSYVAKLFAYLQATGEPFHRPKAILYTSDPLPGSARRLIEEGFHIPVFSIYEATEAYNIGFQCGQHSGLHLNIDLYPVRISDASGHTVPDGESGDVVISNLVNRAMVLLNYNLGDTATILPDECPCGRSLPLLSQVEGRGQDWIELASGKLLHPQAVSGIFKFDERIWQYQVVQESTMHFRVALVTAETCDREQIRQRVAAEFARLFGQDTTVDIRFGLPERTAAGKVRPVISARTKELFSAYHGSRDVESNGADSRAK